MSKPDELRLTLQIVDENTGELYGTVDDVQEYNLAMATSQSSIALDIQDIIEYARMRCDT